MSNYQIRVGGFGGQGVMLFGQMLAYAATYSDMNALWLPSYGPETRGGTANCGVILSHEPIASPIFKNPSHLVAFNGSSLNKFNEFMKEGTYILYNSSNIDPSSVFTKAKAIGVPINDIANELGMGQVANMVMIGAFLELTGLFNDEVIEKVLRKILGEKKAKFIPINLEAINRGKAEVRKQLGR